MLGMDTGSANLLAVSPRLSYSSTLRLSFPICEMGIIHLHPRDVRAKWEEEYKVPGFEPGSPKALNK